MSAVLITDGKFQAHENGRPLNGGLVRFFSPGASTPKTSYSDAALTTPNSHPVVLDSQGRASIYIDGNADIEVRDSLGNLVYEQDDINLTPTKRGEVNLAVNGSFEITTDGVADGWTETEIGTVEIDTTDVAHGKNSYRFVSTGSGGGTIESTDFLDISPNHTYLLMFEVKSSVVDVRNIVEIRWYDETESFLSSSTAYDDATTNPTSWTLQNFEVNPPAAARLAKLRFTGCDASDTTVGSTRYDNLVFQVLPGRVRELVLLRDEKASGVDGGTSTAGSWQTRDVNTEVYDTHNLCTLSSNEFTLDPGTWLIYASSPAKQVDRHQIRLQDITNTATIAYGTSELSGSGDNIISRSFLVARFTISAQTIFAIQHRCSTTRASDGFGLSSNWGNISVYTTIKLERIAI